MKKKMYVAMVAMMTAVALSGCGKGANYESIADTAMATDAAAGVEWTDDSAEMAVEEEMGGTSASTVNTDDVKQSQDKIIYTYNYSVETKEFDKFMDMVDARISEYGGYTESADINGNEALGQYRYANLVIRIPSDRIREFLDMVSTNSNVTYSHKSSDNVTLQYVDLQSHIKALKVEQESLMNLLAKAESVEDIISLQSQLTQVRYEIESYESQLRTFDNKIDYTTLYLDVSEVKRETTVEKLTYGQEIMTGLSDTFYELGQGLRSFSIWFIVNLPNMVVWAVILAVLFVVVRFVVKKHKIRKAKKAAQKAVSEKEDETSE